MRAVPQQARVIADIDDYKLLLIATLALLRSGHFQDVERTSRAHSGRGVTTARPANERPSPTPPVSLRLPRRADRAECGDHRVGITMEDAMIRQGFHRSFRARNSPVLAFARVAAAA